MKYRKATVLAQESATTPATKTIDLDLTEVISRLRIQVRATNSNNTMIGHPAKIIKNVQLVDGSDVLLSLTGEELQAVSFYGTKKRQMDVISFMTGDITQPAMDIFFGRHMWDSLLAFDPKKFTNPQLKIQHDLGLGGSTPTAMTLAVYADLFDEKVVSPSGFLMNKEIYSYNAAANAHKYIDLPTDFPYRMLIIQALAPDKMPSDQLNNIKLSENIDKKVVMDLGVKDLLKNLLTETDPLIEDILAYIANTSTRVWTQIGYEGVAVGNNYGLTGYLMANGGIAGGTFNATSATSANVRFLTRGWCPHSALQIMPGNLDDPEDWYDPTALKSLRLDILGDTAPTTTTPVNIITQQIRKY